MENTELKAYSTSDIFIGNKEVLAAPESIHSLSGLKEFLQVAALSIWCKERLSK